MHSKLLFATVFAVIAAPPSALACQLLDPLPIAFWPTAPTTDQLQPGEVALEVEFSRLARPHDPSNTDKVIIWGCGPDRVFKIVRVLAGEDPGQEFVLLPIGYAPSPEGKPARVLVGRLLPLEIRSTSAFWPDANPSLRTFAPRLPPSNTP